MNEASPVTISSAAKLLGRYGIEAGFVTPTATGLDKGIMDATWPLREYLARAGFHDYKQQGQGPAAKRVVSAQFIRANSVIPVEVSMYRPETKQGDPRIWIYGLTRYASPDDLIALIVNAGNLIIVNCTSEDLASLLADENSLLGGIAARLDTYAGVAIELRQRLKEIGAKGFVPSMRTGDTGIGYTLEALLGIQANSSRSPDFHGIELKSARMSNRQRSAAFQHITLFSKTPEWKRSRFTARQALETFGYRDAATDRLQLFCSIDAGQTNSLGFRLQVRPETDFLANMSFARVVEGEEVFIWLMAALRDAFSSKHRETFWISANSKRVDGNEHFHYVEARHTRRPPLSTFERLLSEGGICVDLTMSEKGKSAVRDHGYLFRIYGARFDELFPEVGVYSLV